jgi:membrane associated rhomboid family serine protease
LIPIRDANPTERHPYATWTLIALNILAFVIWQQFPLTGSDLSLDQQKVIFCNGAIPSELSSFREIPVLERECAVHSPLFSLFTSMFLHANLLHIGGNLLFLWVFGNNIEDRMGPIVFVLFYLAAGVVAAYAQVLIDPGSDIPLIGASGAIAGALGAYIVTFPRARILTLIFFFFITFLELPAFLVLGLWFALQFLSGVGTLQVPGGEGGVAFFAHIGGFAFGALIAFLFYRRPRVQQAPPGWEY